MSLNTLTDLYYRVCQFIHNETTEYDFSGFSLSQNGSGDITISYWTYAFDEPVYEDLENIIYDDVVEWFAQQSELSKVITLASLSTTTRDTMTPSDGMLIFNKTTGHVQCYYSSTWNDL